MLYEWRSKIEPHQKHPHDELVKAIGEAKASKAAARIRKLRLLDMIPKVMSLVEDARAEGKQEYARVVEWVRKMSTHDGRISLISQCGGTMQSGATMGDESAERASDGAADEADDAGVLRNNSIVIVFGLKSEQGRPSNHEQGKIRAYNTMTCRCVSSTHVTFLTTRVPFRPNDIPRFSRRPYLISADIPSSLHKR